MSDTNRSALVMTVHLVRLIVLYFLFSYYYILPCLGFFFFFFFKQKTAYEIVMCWSSDVCSSDLGRRRTAGPRRTSCRTARADRPGDPSHADRHACIPDAGQRGPLREFYDLPAAARIQAAEGEQERRRPEDREHSQCRAERAEQERHRDLAHVDETHAHAYRFAGPAGGRRVMEQRHDHRLRHPEP